MVLVAEPERHQLPSRPLLPGQVIQSSRMAAVDVAIGKPVLPGVQGPQGRGPSGRVPLRSKGKRAPAAAEGGPAAVGVLHGQEPIDARRGRRFDPLAVGLAAGIQEHHAGPAGRRPCRRRRARRRRRRSSPSRPAAAWVKGCTCRCWPASSQSRQPSAPTSPVAAARALMASVVFQTARLVSIGQEPSCADRVEQEADAAAGHGVLGPARRGQAHHHEARQRHGLEESAAGRLHATRASRRLGRTASRRTSQTSGFRGQRWKNRAWPTATRAGTA